MPCRRFIHAIRDHALGAPLDAAAAAHLSGCVDCQGAFDEQRTLIERAEEDLRQLLTVTASPGFAARTSAGLAHTAHSARSPSREPGAWAGLAAAAALVIAVAGASFTSRTRPVPERNVSGAAHEPAAAEPVEDIGAAGSGAAEGGASFAADAPPAPPHADSGAAARVRPPLSVRDRQQEDPVVLVPPEQARAIARLQELTARGILHAEELPTASAVDAAVPELVIAPLVVPEIRTPEIQAASRAPHDTVYAP
jgi:hypothetical protein